MISSGARRDDQQRPSQEGSLDTARVTSTLTPGAVDLYWIPLGAGAHVVRLSGKLYEAIKAFVGHRPRCALQHGVGGGRPRRSLRDRVRTDQGQRGTRAWRRCRRPGRNELGRTVPAVSLRDPPMVRRLHPRCERGRPEPGPRRGRPRSRAAGPRSGAVRPDPGVGPRRAAHRRHVELVKVQAQAF